MGKKASHAGQECISSKEMVLRSEDTLEEDPDERERFELCETWKNSKLEMLCFLRKKKKKKMFTLSSLSSGSSAISSNLRFSDTESEDGEYKLKINQ